MKKLLLTLTILTGSAACAPIPAHLPPDTQTCTEDMECWDWRTMGDHTRGICMEVGGIGHWFLEHADGTITDDHPFGYEPCPNPIGMLANYETWTFIFY